MSSRTEPPYSWLGGFRTKLLVAMMVVVTAVAIVSLLFAQHNVAETVRRDFEREFQGELFALHAVQELRHAVLAERCRELARRPRIHAALEDNAQDLLYPSARDELLDILEGDDATQQESGVYALHALYYRFLDARGRVISPPDEKDVGILGPGEASRLSLERLPARPETGYFRRRIPGAGETLDEVIAMPILSTETGEVISAIVIGFRPAGPDNMRANSGISGGIWLDGRLDLPSVPVVGRAEFASVVSRAISPDATEGSLQVEAAGVPYLLGYKWLNPGSPFPPAYEVSIYPLVQSLARQRRLLWQYSGAAAILVLGAYGASNLLSSRLSRPVEKMAVDSVQDRSQRKRAEAALELKSEELQRSARFSANASHQLKTPVTVLRAGLEELLAGEHLAPAAREEVSGLVHQTFRLANVIEDLLLLSRMDAGRLQIQFSTFDLVPLIEGCLDDLGAAPDAAGLEVESDYPKQLMATGEKGYVAIILQNLMENARKYNRPGGRIRIVARQEAEWAVVDIGNTGVPVPPSAQTHIFERFHRAGVGENIPGHGIGLNLARELAKLHGGDLCLSRSDDTWTEFEVRFRLAGTAADPSQPP